MMFHLFYNQIGSPHICKFISIRFKILMIPLLFIRILRYFAILTDIYQGSMNKYYKGSSFQELKTEIQSRFNSIKSKLLNRKYCKFDAYHQSQKKIYEKFDNYLQNIHKQQHFFQETMNSGNTQLLKIMNKRKAAIDSSLDKYSKMRKTFSQFSQSKKVWEDKNLMHMSMAEKNTAEFGKINSSNMKEQNKIKNQSTKKQPHKNKRSKTQPIQSQFKQIRTLIKRRIRSIEKNPFTSKFDKGKSLNKRAQSKHKIECDARKDLKLKIMTHPLILSRYRSQMSSQKKDY